MRAEKHLESCDEFGCKYNSHDYNRAKGECCWGYRNDKGCFLDIQERTKNYRKLMSEFEYEVIEEDLTLNLLEVWE